MAEPERQSQTARRGHGPHQPSYEITSFTDHSGGRGQSIYERGSQGVPQFSFQIYSTIPTEVDLPSIVEYLAGDRFSEYKARLDIYSPLADVFACVEHQKEEIRYRKSQWQSQGQSSSIRRIPMYQEDSSSEPKGLIIILTSSSYLHSDDKEDPNGPLFAWFDRRFHNSVVDPSSLVAPNPGFYMEEEELRMHEKPEVIFKRVHQRHTLESNLFQYASGACYEPDFGPEDEFAISEESTASRISSVPEVEVPDNLRIASVIDHTGHAGAEASNYDGDEKPLLQYLVYPIFSSSSSLDLHNVARVFSSAVLSYLPVNTTLHIEVFQAPSPSLQSIINHARAELLAHPELKIGRLRPEPNPNATRQYLVPQGASAVQLHPDERRYKTFVVVLDREDFVGEAGVLYVAADMDYEVVKELLPEGMAIPDMLEIFVLRSPSMETVAKRLGGSLQET